MREDLDLLRGAVDSHQHAGPSLFPRLMDIIEAAEIARSWGMRGILVKHHHTSTTDRAYIASKSVPDVEVYGGVTLNYAVGGLNPFAVDACLKQGGRMVWMPSVDAFNHSRHFGELGKYGDRLNYDKPGIYEGIEGITILDEDEELVPPVYEILDLIADADAAVATSHLSPDESRALVEVAEMKGVRLVVTHANFVTAGLSLDEQRWFADMGVYLEVCYSSLSPAWRNVSIDEVSETIKTIGAENYIIASDLGQVHNPPPPEGLRILITMLLERGLSSEEIRLMVKRNPEDLMGLT
ncbi:MAG: DUF6282 family protein [Candidatus Bathyarchaeia archaeon]